MEVAICCFEACLAGQKPPITPMITEKRSPARRIAGVIWKSKVISLKLSQFMVPVDWPWTGSEKRQPSTPPTRESIVDSMTKEVMMLHGRKPRASIVPISRVLEATVAYIVFKAPEMAPIDIMTVKNIPRLLMIWINS